MYIQALFLDLDGTSLNSQNALSPRLVHALHKVNSMDVEVIFCTGRGFPATKPFVEQLGICNYVINYNAAKILDLNINQLIHESTLPASTIDKIFDFAKETNLSPSFYHNDIFFSQTLNDDMAYFRDTIGEQYRIYDNKNEIVNLSITKGLYVVPKIDIETLRTQAMKYFHEATVNSSSDTYLEIMPKDITKAFGVKKVIEQLDIQPENCMAFGDQWNDFEMLKFVGKGFVMGNAPALLKQEFPEHQHAATNDNNGVAIQLEKHFGFTYE